jgi:serine/threonine protein kinase
MGVCMEKDNLMLVMEYCQNGDVHTLLNGQTPLTFFQRMQIARDVALAMNWLHCMVRAAHACGPPLCPL